ncbi:hypothetical protein OII99_005264 [Salmonella enterica]|nr:hypothetical protein [Salmonella enterica]
MSSLCQPRKKVTEGISGVAEDSGDIFPQDYGAMLFSAVCLASVVSAS